MKRRDFIKVAGLGTAGAASLAAPAIAQSMPELKWRGGYFAILGVMAAICATLYWRFRRAGWL